MTEVGGGTALIRQALKARNSKVNLSLFSRDLGLTGDQVHSFLNGNDLSPDHKRAMAEYLWPYTTWDEATDKLKPTKKQEPTPMGSCPQLDPRLLRKYQAGACQTPIRPVKDSPPVKSNKRDGWLGSWW